MVQFDSSDQRLATLPTDCLAIGLFEDDELSVPLRALDAAAGGLLRKLRSAGDLPVRPGETQLLLAPAGLKTRRLLVVGLGRRAEFRQRGWRKAVSVAQASKGSSGGGWLWTWWVAKRSTGVAVSGSTATSWPATTAPHHLAQSTGPHKRSPARGGASKHTAAGSPRRLTPRRPGHPWGPAPPRS